MELTSEVQSFQIQNSPFCETRSSQLDSDNYSLKNSKQNERSIKVQCFNLTYPCTHPAGKRFSKLDSFTPKTMQSFELKKCCKKTFLLRKRRRRRFGNLVCVVRFLEKMFCHVNRFTFLGKA